MSKIWSVERRAAKGVKVPGPERSGGVQLAKKQSRASKRSVDAVRDRRRGGRGGGDRRCEGGDDVEREETRGLPLLRGGKNLTRTPENRKR